MRRVRSILARWFAATALLAQAAAAQPAAPPEPDGYRMLDYRSPTPSTLNGAEVVGTGEAAALWSEGLSAFIDVLPRVPKPQNLPPGTIWRHPPRQLAGRDMAAEHRLRSPERGGRSLLPARSPNGNQRGSAETDQAFLCQRACWMSWNAAKRALEYGYGRVSWFPDGTDGWLDAGLPLQRTEPYP